MLVESNHKPKDCVSSISCLPEILKLIHKTTLKNPKSLKIQISCMYTQLHKILLTKQSTIQTACTLLSV